jgi:hypothetical protein
LQLPTWNRWRNKKSPTHHPKNKDPLQHQTKKSQKMTFATIAILTEFFPPVLARLSHSYLLPELSTSDESWTLDLLPERPPKLTALYDWKVAPNEPTVVVGQPYQSLSFLVLSGDEKPKLGSHKRLASVPEHGGWRKSGDREYRTLESSTCE